MIKEVSRDCPYCGERIGLSVDRSAGDQDYTEDCSVCCQPIRVRVRLGDGRLAVELEREND